MQLPYQNNFKTLDNYGNKNIDKSLAPLNTKIVNNLKEGETYLTAFNRLYDRGELKGQLKVQGAVDKQAKFLEEFLVYPPYEKIVDINKDCKKISISELWKGKFSYRKFQDYMYDVVGKEYGFDLARRDSNPQPQQKVTLDY